MRLKCIVKVGLFLILILGVGGMCYLFLLLIGVFDDIAPTPSIMRTHSRPAFHAQATDIRPLLFNVDTTKLEYEYVTSLRGSDSLFSIIEKQSFKEGWRLTYSNGNERRYIRVDSSSAFHDQGVTVKYDAERSVVKIITYRTCKERGPVVDGDGEYSGNSASRRIKTEDSC